MQDLTTKFCLIDYNYMKLSKTVILLILTSFLASTYAFNNGRYDLNENQQYIFEHEEAKEDRVENEDSIEDEVVLKKRSEQSSQVSKKLVQSLIFSRVDTTLAITIRPPKISA